MADMNEPEVDRIHESGYDQGQMEAAKLALEGVFGRPASVMSSEHNIGRALKRQAQYAELAQWANGYAVRWGEQASEMTRRLEADAKRKASE